MNGLVPCPLGEFRERHPLEEFVLLSTGRRVDRAENLWELSTKPVDLQQLPR